MLTDEDRAAINVIRNVWGASGREGSFKLHERLYSAGLNAGLERAARYCRDEATWDSEHHDMWYVGFNAACEECAAGISELKEQQL